MKNAILLLLLAVCLANAEEQNTKIFNNREQFQGRIIGEPGNQRILDNNGRFKGRIIQDKNDSSPRIYEMDKGVLKYRGRIVK